MRRYKDFLLQLERLTHLMARSVRAHLWQFRRWQARNGWPPDYVVDLRKRQVVGSIKFDHGVRPPCAVYDKHRNVLYVTINLQSWAVTSLIQAGRMKMVWHWPKKRSMKASLNPSRPSNGKVHDQQSQGEHDDDTA